MGSITIREYEYGHPKNEDYAYDTFREERDMDNLGGDNKQQNSPAEIYANVRNRALEEAAKVCEGANEWDKYSQHYPSPDSIADSIRALKTPEAT